MPLRHRSRTTWSRATLPASMFFDAGTLRKRHRFRSSMTTSCTTPFGISLATWPRAGNVHRQQYLRRTTTRPISRNGGAIYSAFPNKVTLQNNMFASNGNSDTTSPARPTIWAMASVPSRSPRRRTARATLSVSPTSSRRDPPPALVPTALVTSSSMATRTDRQISRDRQRLGTDRHHERPAGQLSGLPWHGLQLPELWTATSVLLNTTAPAATPWAASSNRDHVARPCWRRYANGSVLSVSNAPNEVTVTFSGNVDQGAISATDLVLSGSAINAANPAHATSLTWIDAYTVEFNLTGRFNNSGTLDINVNQGAIKSTGGSANAGYL